MFLKFNFPTETHILWHLKGALEWRGFGTAFVFDNRNVLLSFAKREMKYIEPIRSRKKKKQ